VANDYLQPASSAVLTSSRPRAGDGVRDTRRLVFIGLAVAAAYVVAAEIGFRFAFVAEQITTVWAPTGIALAVFLFWGVRLWPAIWLGAFLANAGTAAPVWTSFVIASGNTLEGVLAVVALRRLPQFDLTFQRIADALSFVVIAALMATSVSATVGVTTLCFGGVQPWERFMSLWFDWWLGDALGAIVIAPAILTTVGQRPWSRRDLGIALVFVAVSVAVTQLVFGHMFGLSTHPLEYVVFPVVIAAAVRGGPAVSSLVVLSISAVTIWNTVHGKGPFASPEVHHSLILLQTFMGVLASTALLLAAAIAERRASEQRQREATDVLGHREQMLRLAMRGGAMGAWSRNLETNDVWWSRELEEIVGLEPGAFKSTEAGFFEFVHDDDRAGVRQAVDDAVERHSDYIVEFRFRHASGEWRWMEGRGRAVYESDGTLRTLYGIGIDITERKGAEMALRDAKTAAESANQLKDQFLATLSHELRTPLNAILGYARMLQTHSIAPEKRQHALDVIERNAVVQHQLVEELLDMSRITTGKIRLDPAPVPVAALLRDAIEGVKPAAAAKHIGLDVDVDPLAGTVSADATRLQQVFWNLLTNAVKFTSQGGRIVASLRRDGSDVEVAIRDTGVGIAPDFLPFVFDPFRQADGRMEQGYGGLGLGLTISRQLVQLHGGTIHVSSGGIGQGATFTIRLPRTSGG
jgi:PAS domain S-box-containing protein